MTVRSDVHVPIAAIKPTGIIQTNSTANITPLQKKIEQILPAFVALQSEWRRCEKIQEMRGIPIMKQSGHTMASKIRTDSR